MDIPNLSQTPTSAGRVKIINPAFLIIMLVLGVAAGFGLSRIAPTKTASSPIDNNKNSNLVTGIEDKKDIEVGKLYGNSSATFKDTAVGTIEKGSINGEGTHILNREGGASQRASLTSSAVDLDLFVGKKVEVKGETNASKKTSWLLDVGTIKVLE